MSKDSEKINNDILTLIQEVEALNARIAEDADSGPIMTRPGRQVAQRQAQTRLPVANLELRNTLLKKAVKIFAVTDDDFLKPSILVEGLSKQGMSNFFGHSYYSHMANRLPWNPGNGLSGEAFAILLDYLREDCRKYGTYANIPVEFPVNKSVNTFQGLVNLVHEVVAKAFGENLEAAYEINYLTRIAAAHYKVNPELVEEPLIFTIPCLTNEQAVLLSSLITPDKFSMIVDLSGEEVSKSVVMKAYQKMYQNLLKSGTIQEVKPEKK